MRDSSEPKTGDIPARHHSSPYSSMKVGEVVLEYILQYHKQHDIKIAAMLQTIITPTLFVELYPEIQKSMDDEKDRALQITYAIIKRESI